LMLRREHHDVNLPPRLGCATWKLGAVDFLFMCYSSERI
jgi:hypothetical protein